MTPLHLAVHSSPLIQPSAYRYKSAKPNHSSASELCKGHCSGVAALSVPWVKNRKGSLLPPHWALWAPRTCPPGRPATGGGGGSQPAFNGPVACLWYTATIPVTPVTPHSVRNSVSPPPPSISHLPFACLAGWTQQQHNQSMCLPVWSGCMCSIPY